ncbi:hypothetical protein DB30_02787 [Enhygromyxa salina]|uniref:Uncharacterized protein n=1 Tax=Enhygromyxa salina TaxID=215803 RepID=A0A0C1ZJW6_9BACT|nr:hypothetical protein DB30_02787 [Enhygromyxa salina]
MLALAPGQVLAHPPASVRTPVDWSDAPCVTIVDRSQDPVALLDYDIPQEDVPDLVDEPLDSHTHQFFGFCRDHDLDERLPNWINLLDVETAEMFGLGTQDAVDPSRDILDSAAQWAGCFTRITPDDPRIPISFEAAAEPVVWDTSALAAGTWVVEGYTYEPWFNLWSPHPGVFKIVDDPDPAASPPAAALLFEEQTVFVGAPVEISGCVDAMDGSTMSLSWVEASTGDPQWQVFEADLPARNGSFELTWEAPQAAASRSMLIKLDVTDPLGREWTAHGFARIGVIAGIGGDGDGDEDTGDEGNGTDETGAETGPGLADDAGASGCGCTSEPRGGAPMLWPFAGLLLLGWRRRPALARGAPVGSDAAPSGLS